MEADPTIFRHWEDLVFAHRNQSYGAYLLRKDYARRVLSGAGLSVTLMLLLFLLQNISFYPDVPADVSPPLTGERITIFPPPSIVTSVNRKPSVQKDVRNVLITKEQVVDDHAAVIPEEVFVAEDLEPGGVVGEPDGSGIFSIPSPEPVIAPVVRDFAEVMPQYEGGMEAMMKFIQKKIRYPRAPKVLGIEGTVYVRFIVAGDGSVTNVEVIRGVHPDYDREAARVISMLSDWKGGSHNGQPVQVRMVLPIKFSLK